MQTLEKLLYDKIPSAGVVHLIASFVYMDKKDDCMKKLLTETNMLYENGLQYFCFPCPRWIGIYDQPPMFYNVISITRMVVSIGVKKWNIHFDPMYKNGWNSTPTCQCIDCLILWRKGKNKKHKLISYIDRRFERLIQRFY